MPGKAIERCCGRPMLLMGGTLLLCDECGTSRVDKDEETEE